MNDLYKRAVKIEQARLFATAAHAATGQKRKYTGEDYIVHPGEVASLIAGVGGTTEMVMASWLHDVVEDTGVGIHVISAEFGPVVADLVDDVTDKAQRWMGNRAKRKAFERDRLAMTRPESQSIKLADLISNTGSIVDHDPEFAKVYLREKAALLEVLTKGNPELLAMARKTLQAGLYKLRTMEIAA